MNFLMQSSNKSDEWFAWYPVRTGALSTGHWVWLKRVWRNRCMGVTIYQPLEVARKATKALHEILTSVPKYSPDIMAIASKRLEVEWP